MTDREMPKYECHKQVRALKIKKLVRDANSNIIGFTPADEHYDSEDYASIPLSEYVTKHKPTAGGYYVVYADGYKSFSPAEAFEAGYRRI